MKNGTTTRLIDNAVQRFFKLNRGEGMLMTDHGNTKEETITFINKFANRMINEHPQDAFEINYDSKIIKRL